MLLLLVPGLTLTAEAQAAPVTVDFPAVADTWFGDYPAFGINGTGTFQFFRVQRVAADLDHSFLRFDLISVFQGSTIISANLSLFHVAYTFLFGTDELNVTAWGTAVGWNEQLLSASIWNRDPRVHPISGVTRPTNNATDGARVEWNVTPLVDAWVQRVLPNHGFRLGWSSGDGQSNFASREALTPANRPFLRVTFIPVAPLDPGAHPLGPFIVQLGVPVDLFLSVVGVAILIMVYFGIYAAVNPELVGRKRRQPPSLRAGLRAFRRRR